MNIKAWDLGQEIDSKTTIPSFVKASYIVTKVVPPKGKTIRDGLVVSAAMISYWNEDGEVIKVTNITEGPSGLEVEFPLGKHYVSATKYRGPKSWYNFVHPTTGKWTNIPHEKFTEEFANQYLSENVTDWATKGDEEKDDYIDSYFEDMYNFGMACDFNFDTSRDNYDTPKVGMIVDFYRKYTPPGEGEKYGNTTITKFPTKKITSIEGLPNLDGSFEQKDAALSEAIILAMTSDNKKKEFDPASDDDMPF